MSILGGLVWNIITLTCLTYQVFKSLLLSCTLSCTQIIDLSFDHQHLFLYGYIFMTGCFLIYYLDAASIFPYSFMTECLHMLTSWFQLLLNDFIRMIECTHCSQIGIRCMFLVFASIYCAIFRFALCLYLDNAVWFASIAFTIPNDTTVSSITSEGLTYLFISSMICFYAYCFAISDKPITVLLRIKNNFFGGIYYVFFNIETKRVRIVLSKYRNEGKRKRSRARYSNIGSYDNKNAEFLREFMLVYVRSEFDGRRYLPLQELMCMIFGLCTEENISLVLLPSIHYYMV